MKKDKSLRIEDGERKTQDMSAVAEYTGEKSNRAKLVEYVGDDYVDTPVKDNSFSGITQNFWYHHKWKVIFSVFALVIAAVSVFQIVTNKSQKTDLSVMYAGPKYIGADYTDDLKDTLSSFLREDFDGNGSKRVGLYSFCYYNSDQIKEAEEAARQRGAEATINLDNNQNVLTQIRDIIFTGECGVMFLDESLYEWVKDSGGVAELRSALGYAPEGSFDGYGIRLSDTAAYGFFPTLSVLPGDTVVCLRSLSTAGGVFTSKKEAEEIYERSVKYFGDFLALGNADK